MSDPVKRAAALFEQGYNCSQSVLAAFAPELGLPEATALKLAAPFGGGIARSGELCGAVSGAIMALGLRYGYILPGDSPEKELVYQKVQAYLAQFQARHGCMLCSELKKAEDCPGLVVSSAGLLAELLA
jgi:C_GCAxxG_C_C family probable redox protein